MNTLRITVTANTEAEARERAIDAARKWWPDAEPSDLEIDVYATVHGTRSIGYCEVAAYTEADVAITRKSRRPSRDG